MPTIRFAEEDNPIIAEHSDSVDKNRFKEMIYFIREEIICNLFLITDAEISSLSQLYRQKMRFVQKQKRNRIRDFCNLNILDQKLFFIRRSLEIITHEHHLLMETVPLLLQIPEITSSIILDTIHETFPSIETNHIFLQQYKLSYALFLGEKKVNRSLFNNWKLDSLLKKSKTETIYLHYLLQMFALLRKRDLEIKSIHDG